MEPDEQRSLGAIDRGDDRACRPEAGDAEAGPVARRHARRLSVARVGPARGSREALPHRVEILGGDGASRPRYETPESAQADALAVFNLECEARKFASDPLGWLVERERSLHRPDTSSPGAPRRRDAASGRATRPGPRAGSMRDAHKKHFIIHLGRFSRERMGPVVHRTPPSRQLRRCAQVMLSLRVKNPARKTQPGAVWNPGRPKPGMKLAPVKAGYLPSSSSIRSCGNQRACDEPAHRAVS